MARVTFGTTLIREWGVFVLCLSDPKLLDAASEDQFQDTLIRKAIGAAKRVRVNKTEADVWTLRNAFKLIADVDGEGKLLELLTERVKTETAAANRRASIQSLQRRMRDMTPDQLAAAIEALK